MNDLTKAIVAIIAEHKPHWARLYPGNAWVACDADVDGELCCFCIFGLMPDQRGLLTVFFLAELSTAWPSTKWDLNDPESVVKLWNELDTIYYYETTSPSSIWSRGAARARRR